MSTNQQATQQQVNVLYQAMAPLGNRALDAARQAPPITTEEAGVLQRTIKQTRPTLRGKEPIRWQEDMWHQVQPGKEAKHFARWDTKPVWRKRLHSDRSGRIKLARAGLPARGINPALIAQRHDFVVQRHGDLHAVSFALPPLPITAFAGDACALRLHISKHRLCAGEIFRPIRTEKTFRINAMISSPP